MRFSSYINNQRCLEWGLNANQGALFDLLNQAVSWANEVIIDGTVFYWVSRNEVIKELPLFYAKPDTVYRHFVELDKKELIEYRKIDGKDLIRLTIKGKTWNEFNSDLNPNTPSKLGNKSESTRIEIRKSSDLNPTNNNTNNKNTIDHNSTLQPAVATRKRTPKFSDDDLKTAHWIFGLLQKLNPNIKTPNFEDWANEVRLMNKVDNRSHREICELFQWANRDPFWQANILSPKKLREKWDQLVMKKSSTANLGRSVVTGTGDWNTAEGWNEVI